jgi:sugar phosphate isomerase/epimerase
MKISVASKVLKDRAPEEVVDLAAALGYGGIEWFCLPQHLPPDTPPARVAALGRRTRDAGLETVCLSTYVGGFADLDDAGCAEQLRRFAQYVEIATQLECPLLRLWPDDMGKTLREPVGDALIDRVASYFQRAADSAAEAGVRIAAEMHQTIGVDVQLLVRLLDAVRRPNVGVIYDPGNVYLAGHPYGREVTEPLAAHILHVQLKEASLSRPTPPHLADEPALRLGGDFDLLIGEGEVDVALVLAALDQIGYSGWCSVESHALPRPGLDSAGIAAAELATLRSLLPGVHTGVRGG